MFGTFSFTKRLLIWDAYKCHTSETVKAELKRMRMHTAIVPGGCTKYIQAADVVWNACFKGHMRQHYDEWLADPTRHQFTKGGNMKAPSRELVCEWVKLSWAAVSEDMVKNSFRSCAVTTSTDGSNDSAIHCFKDHQPCAEGKELLKKETEKLLTTVVSNAMRAPVDPFASDNDSDEEDTNEVHIGDEEDDSDGGDEDQDEEYTDDDEDQDDDEDSMDQ